MTALTTTDNLHSPHPAARSASAQVVPSDLAALSEVSLARALLDAQALAVGNLSVSLSAQADAFTRAVDLIDKCVHARGSVLVTGLGKSGLVGAKTSATMASLGIASHFIHPSEAAHGDLGNFRTSDICIALSYSGETDEVVALAAVLRQDGVPVIGITAGPREPASTSETPSSLDRLSTVALSIGRVEEAAGFGPAPMCSTTAMMTLGDALALCASRRLAFTDADFLKRHPGGSLGGLFKPIVEALRFVVGKNYQPIPDDLTVGEALRQSELIARRPGAILLVDRSRGTLTGIFTDADLRRVVLRDPGALEQPISQFMTRSPSCLPSSARVQDAVHMVQEFRRDEIPVVDAEGKPVGLLDVQDLIAMRLVNE